ncbi:hypothetical protein lacNasYZ03_01370 [Lactobacillus nasalidis]|uniref:Surface layer protein A domain-containing protein n=1 Tax=Lactobacillus nasalidis TaxID=2797258 RepID=A0ABQ3W540_9LACO|nr:hypothetical protein lacNasYZ01_16050 [Lactobacillus nasalidis]GHV98889.1 hypothetical protein lacNasYZ02_03190 [Lactobacillus nasalidis]GHW00450.1 hypothetical protein lacNasYZ03_01370 [Lactobacillus nasalidis]
MTVVSKNGKQVRLYDDKGNATKTYKKNGSKFVVYEQATINGQLMYRIGSSKQWIPAKYSKVTLKKTTTTKKTTAYTTVYNSKGKPVKIYKRIKSEFGPTVETHIKKGSAVVVHGQGPINGQLMYNITTMTKNGDYTKKYWVPAKDVKVDYFTDVDYADYDTHHYGSTPTKAKANYEAELAETENSNPKYDEGLIFWEDAHPLEMLREESQTVKIAKSTYEKHNQTYAQRLAYRSRNGLGWTKESYTAYMKGEAAYRQYEAKWAAKYPNITRSMKVVLETDSYYKKFNLNTFEWHFNDKFFTAKNIRK